MEKKSAETIVKVLSVLGYIGAAFGVIVGLIFLFGGPSIASIMPIPAPLNAIAGVALIVVGIVMVAVSVLGFFVAKGLWDHKNWARIVCIVFAAFGILNGLFSLPGGLIGVVLNGLVIYFLAFDKTAIKLFK